MGEIFLFCIVVVSVVLLSFAVFKASGRTASRPDPTTKTQALRVTDGFMERLPSIFYKLAVFCGVVLVAFTFAISDDLSGSEIGVLVGWIVGSVLSILAVGRVLELLQQIRDEIRLSSPHKKKVDQAQVPRDPVTPPAEDDPR